MHLLILGGSGRTGKVVIADALYKGHTITALVRKEGTLDPNPNLTIAIGTPLSRADVGAAFTTSGKPVDAVIVNLTALRETDSPFANPISPAMMMADAHSNLLSAMEKHNVRRLVTMSAFGAGDSFPNLNPLLKLLFRHSNMSYDFQFHDEVDKRVRAAGNVDWTLVRPVMLADGASKPCKDHGDLGKDVWVTASITRASAARMLLDAAESRKWIKRTPVVSD